MKHKLAFLGIALIAAGCGSTVRPAASEMEALPTTLLPVTPYRAAITAAEKPSAYRNLVEAYFESWVDTNIFHADYSHFLKDVQSGSNPIGLHDFLQHQDMLMGGITSYPDLLVGRVGGRYNVIPAIPLSGKLEFGEDFFRFFFEGSYYFKTDLAAGLEVETGDIGVEYTNLYLFARWATKTTDAQALYLEGGFRFNDGPDDGLFILGEYYLNQVMSFGAYFSTDAWEEIVGAFALRFPQGFGVRAEVGSKADDFYLKAGGEYRF